jgi:hypothetical protein
MQQPTENTDYDDCVIMVRVKVCLPPTHHSRVAVGRLLRYRRTRRVASHPGKFTVKLLSGEVVEVPPASIADLGPLEQLALQAE